MGDTIQDILSIQFLGNYHSDAHHFDRIDRFLRSDAALSDKISALHHLSSNGMGLDTITDESDLIAWLSEPPQYWD